MAKTLILKFIKLYQKTLSLDHGFFSYLNGNIFRVGCRYFPSCSEYTYEAVEKYGSVKGLTLGAKRILRCHPFSKGGFDPLV